MKKDIWLTKDEILFYVAWSLFLLTTMFDLTAYSKIVEGVIIAKGIQCIRYGSYALCIISICYKIFLKSKIMGIIGIALILLLSLLGSANKTMFLYIFLIVAACGLTAKNVIMVSFFIGGLFWLVIVFGSQIGIIEDYIFEPKLRARHSLGFAWATHGPILYFFLVLQYVYLRKQKITYMELAILETINIVLYVLTDSRMAFLLLSLFILTMLLVKIGKNKWFLVEKTKWLWVAVPTIIASIAIAIHAFYSPESIIWQKLNDILSGRLQLGKDAIADFGFTLFGQYIEWKGFSIGHLSGEGYNYVDCSYLQLILEYGSIFLILILILYSFVIYKCIKKKNYYLLWSIVFVLVLSITEPRLMNLAFNPFPVIFLCEIEGEKKRYVKTKIDKT